MVTGDTGDQLLNLQEQAEAAVREVNRLADRVPVYAAVYGLGEAISMLTVVIAEMATTLTPDEQLVLADALSSVVAVTEAADKTLGNIRSDAGMWPRTVDIETKMA
jgi:hypothetical protein